MKLYIAFVYIILTIPNICLDFIMDGLKQWIQLKFQAFFHLLEVDADKINICVHYCLIHSLLAESFSVFYCLNYRFWELGDWSQPNLFHSIKVEVSARGMRERSKVNNLRGFNSRGWWWWLYFFMRAWFLDGLLRRLSFRWSFFIWHLMLMFNLELHS